MSDVKPAVVTAEALSRWWSQVEHAKGLYRIADGYSRQNFDQVYIEARLVYEFSWGFARCEKRESDAVRIHPVVTGPEFNDAESIQLTNRAIVDACTRLGVKRALSFVPVNLLSKAVRKIALRFGFKDTGVEETIPYTGVPVRCRIYEREV
jgi:hypothetical protein